MRYRITHITQYESSEPVSVCHNQAWLTPRSSDRQVCCSHQLKICPEPSTQFSQTDAFGNTVTRFSFNEGYTSLKVCAASVVNVENHTGHNGASMPTWDSVASALRNPQTADELEAMEFCFDSPRIHNTVKLAGYARAAFPPECSIQDAVVDLTRRIHADFEYDPRATTVTTPMAEVMSRRKGVCQDFAHLEIGMLRSLGLAARYVSGYVRTHPPEGQRCLVGADASHAWLSVYCGEAGWIDVDPTNNCFAEADHIMVAWGRDYSDVTPLRGVYTGGGRHSLSVSVEVVVI